MPQNQQMTPMSSVPTPSPVPGPSGAPSVVAPAPQPSRKVDTFGKFLATNSASFQQAQQERVFQETQEEIALRAQQWNVRTEQGRSAFGRAIREGSRELGASPFVQAAVQRQVFQDAAKAVMLDLQTAYMRNDSEIKGASPDAVSGWAQKYISDAAESMGLSPQDDPLAITTFNASMERHLDGFMNLAQNIHVKMTGSKFRTALASDAGDEFRLRLASAQGLYDARDPDESRAVRQVAAGTAAEEITSHIQAAYRDGVTKVDALEDVARALGDSAETEAQAWFDTSDVGEISAKAEVLSEYLQDVYEMALGPDGEPLINDQRSMGLLNDTLSKLRTLESQALSQASSNRKMARLNASSWVSETALEAAKAVENPAEASAIAFRAMHEAGQYNAETREQATKVIKDYFEWKEYGEGYSSLTEDQKDGLFYDYLNARTPAARDAILDQLNTPAERHDFRRRLQVQRTEYGALANEAYEKRVMSFVKNRVPIEDPKDINMHNLVVAAARHTFLPALREPAYFTNDDGSPMTPIQAEARIDALVQKALDAADYASSYVDSQKNLDIPGMKPSEATRLGGQITKQLAQTVDSKERIEETLAKAQEDLGIDQLIEQADNLLADIEDTPRPNTATELVYQLELVDGETGTLKDLSQRNVLGAANAIFSAMNELGIDTLAGVDSMPVKQELLNVLQNTLIPTERAQELMGTENLADRHFVVSPFLRSILEAEGAPLSAVPTREEVLSQLRGIILEKAGFDDPQAAVDEEALVNTPAVRNNMVSLEADEVAARAPRLILETAPDMIGGMPKDDFVREITEAIASESFGRIDLEDLSPELRKSLEAENIPLGTSRYIQGRLQEALRQIALRYSR